MARKKADKAKTKAKKPGKRMNVDRATLTQAKAEIILENIESGLPIKYACAIAGVSTQVFKHEMEAQPQLQAAYEEASAKCMLHHVGRIKDGERQWQSSAWYLERRFRDEFSNKDGSGENERTVYVRRVNRNKGQVANLGRTGDSDDGDTSDELEVRIGGKSKDHDDQSVSEAA